MKFKEILKNDNSIFLNFNEFADEHIINEKKILAIIDYTQIQNVTSRINVYADGISKKKMIMYVKKVDFGKLPSIKTQSIIDGKPYRVFNAVEENGIYIICWEMNRI